MCFFLVCFVAWIYFQKDMLIKLRHSLAHHKPWEGIRGTSTHTNVIPFDYSLLLFQIYSALCCICCPFCVSGMMERSSLICLAVTTAMSKLLAPCWFFQWAHYNLQFNKDSPEIYFVSFLLVNRLVLKEANVRNCITNMYIKQVT